MENRRAKFLGGGVEQVCILLIFLWVLFHFSGEYAFDNGKAEMLEPYSIDNCSEEQMYQYYIGTLLEEKLYTKRDAYDAAHYLMAPMHYAYQSGKSEYIELFQKYMENLASSDEKEKEYIRNLGDVDRMQYYYFLSEYMVLCTESGKQTDQDLFQFLYEEIRNYSESYEGNWESAAEYKNLWELLDGLMDGEGYGNGKSYEHAITGNELKTLAILCDLGFTYKSSKSELECEEEIFHKAAEYANRITDSQIVWYEDGTWQFQPGVNRDYPDFQFAGIEDPNEIKEGMDYRMENVVGDSGHFMRWPLYLRSFQRVQDIERKQKYDRLLEGCAKTFLDKVLVAPDKTCPYYRLTNYMDGRNGLFRWGYHEDKAGYGPFQQSEAYLLGWWAFCGSDEIAESYEYTARRFPLDAMGREVYLDPVTVRAQNPIFLMENYEQFLCYLASKIIF